MKATTLSVTGMKCSHCEANVQNALLAVPGVKLAKADRANNKVDVEYDEQLVKPAQLADAVNALGSYECSL